MGFEFELNVPVSLDDAEIPSTAPKGMRKTYEFVMAKGLEEKTELADRGYAGGGFKVVVDHGPISEKVDSYKRLFTEDIYVGETVRENFGADAYETGRLEYVTAALDETRPDYQKAFTDQLNPLVVSIKALRNKDPAHNAIPISDGIDVLVGIPAELSVPLTRAGQEAGELLDDESYEPVFTAEKAMRADVHFQSYMQATAGVDTQRVGTFLRQEAADAGDYVSTPLHVAVVLATRDHSPGVIARILQVSDLARYDARTNSEVEGFLTLLLQYVIGDCIWQTIPEAQSIPKNIGPFWIKMDLATYRGRLPQPAQDLLKTVTSRAYKELLAMHGRLLQERMPKSGRTREPAIDLIQNFLSGALAGNSDGFTEPMLTNFDQLGGGGQGAPLEFRSIRAHPSPDEIVGTAMAVVEKVRRTNG
ncbi:MAG: hypothetical protein ACRDQ5_09980 [Sciscionella sp.]